MALISNYPNGFANTLVVRGLPVQISNPGKVWWLNNSAVLPPGSLSNSSIQIGSYTNPFYTMAQAMTAIIADSGSNRGDILMVAPGHAETVSSATALTLNVPGLMIIGQGTGSLRPTYTLDTANTATINVTAANMSIVNCKFVANFLAIASCFTLTAAAGLSISGNAFADTSAILNFALIVKTSTVDNAADGLLVENNEIISSHATNAFSVISPLGNMDRVRVVNNDIRLTTTSAVAALAPIAAGKLMTNAYIDNNRFNLVNAAGTTTGLLITTNGTTNSGLIRNNSIFALTATGEILVTANAGFKFYNNLYSRAADTSGFVLPAIGSV
jgi:hypothetical protein